MLRVLLVFTNLAGVRPICRACWPVSAALFLAMMASMVFHATVGSTVTTVWQTELATGLDDDDLLGFILDTRIGRLCRERSHDLLLIDQLCALNAIVVTLACYGMPNIRSTLLALLLLYLGDQGSGLGRAILHSVWHNLAFAIVDELIEFNKKKRE